MITDLELLDYSILAYQLHAQTLLCAPDPYCEQMQRQKNFERKTEENKERRYRFLAALESTLALNQIQNRQHEYADIKGFLTAAPALGRLVSVAPIPAKYDRISPHFPGYVRPDRDDGAEGWIRYQAPASITGTIGQWQTCAYQSNDCPPAPGSNPVWIASALSPAQPPQGQQDRLYCFGGGTGMTKDVTSLGVWSLMGFVLARRQTQPQQALPSNLLYAAQLSPQPQSQLYDLVVAFRGSRSGHMSLHRMSTVKITGADPNPDWKTNLNDDFVSEPEIANIAPRKVMLITHQGKMVQGFAKALKTMLPSIRACVDQAKNDMGGLPDSVYITGHSLGGALATCFCSAALLGNGSAFGSTAQFTALERRIWDRAQLVTFAAPPVGNDEFKVQFNLKAATARAYRFATDAVPNLGKGKLVGTDMVMHRVGDVPYAHNPKPIREEVKALLNFNDNEEPWTEGLKAKDVVRDLAARGQVPGLPYRFRDGLVVYLIALAYMRKPTQPWDYVLDPQTQRPILLNFVDLVCPPINPPGQPVNANFNWTGQPPDSLPNNLEVEFQKIATIPAVQGQPGMVKMLKHWLALIMVQSGGNINVANPPVWFDL